MSSDDSFATFATLSPIENLIQLLDVEPIEVDMFRGRRTNEAWQRVFGGQVVGQALSAATRTVDSSRPVHSLHAYFIRPGDPAKPIIYRVERDRDGKSFTTRRVVAIQHGRPILNLAASYQVHEEGPEYQDDMPDVVGPEDLKSESELNRAQADKFPERIRALLLRERPIEFRPVPPYDIFRSTPTEPRQYFWFKATGPLPDEDALHRCMLAYASDMMLLSTSLLPHGVNWFEGKVQEASLDHAVWFHKSPRLDDWLLYALDSPKSGGARGFNRGAIYTRTGQLIASVAQEGLIRPRG